MRIDPTVSMSAPVTSDLGTLHSKFRCANQHMGMECMEDLLGRQSVGKERCWLVIPDNHNPLIHPWLQQCPTQHFHLHGL